MTKATNILSNLESVGTNGLRDIKPPLDIPNPWAWVLMGVGVCALAAIAVAVCLLLLKRRAIAALPPVIPAHVRAKDKLQAALKLIGQPREFCIAVSDTIRSYLEERFDFHAPERTTEEFLHELQATTLLLPPQKESLAEFLRRCDLVKFARYEPREPELHDLHDAAVQLVDETVPVQVEAVPAESSPT